MITGEERIKDDHWYLLSKAKRTIGYLSMSEAKKARMTHHGSYYGIPVWMAPEHEDFPVCAKWSPIDRVMTLFHHIEGIMRPILFPNDEPVFQFKIGDKIE